MRIHRYWTGDAPLPSISSYAKKAAEGVGRVTDWTDRTLPADLKIMLDFHESRVPEGERIRQRANIVRLGLLRAFGGLWLDHDALLISLPAPPRGLWTAWSGGQVCSAIMHADAGDRALSEAIASIREADTARKSSGELMLTEKWPDVPHYELPLNYYGRPTGAPAWAVHTWSTG